MSFTYKVIDMFCRHPHNRKTCCETFDSRFMEGSSNQYPTLETKFLTSLQQLFSQGFVINNNTISVLDQGTPMTFDNQYYENLPFGHSSLDSD